jgi:triosephosphate isomerase
METPVIVINFKTYPEVCGESCLELAELCQSIAKKTKKSIAIAPQQIDLAHFSRTLKIPVLAQHVDNVKQGGSTGRVTPEAIKAIGCAGTLINHSEYRLPAKDVEELVARCRKVGLVSIVCTKDAAESQAYSEFIPDFVAVEPPELIGGEISVTTASPEVITNTVKAVKFASPGVKILCGAGVKNGKDVKKAIELGTDGVLLASGVVKASDRKAVLLDLVGGI